MSETSNNPYKNLSSQDRDVEASAASHPSPLPSPNPFLDPPNAPPPAYNFHADERNLFLPPNTTMSRSPSPYPSTSPFKRSESPTAAYYQRQQYNKRRFFCFMIAIIVMILIALIIAGVAFKWGRNNVCVHWNDGTSSGDCGS
ncbi:hypothetical protein BDZ45DRAFT_745297 [Acephala macrosclerotiorum]|nr:hypothetical protein BDZ45DRAFT_745297 [Acephala macrosclerotiorum]